MTALYSKPIEASSEMTSGWVLMRRLVTDYLWRYRISVGIGIVCMAVVAGATAANAWMMEPVLDKLFLEKDTTMLLILPAIVAAIAVVKAAAAFGQNYLIDGSSLRVATDVQADVYVHLMRSDLKLFQDTASGQLLSNFLTDALYLRQALGRDQVAQHGKIGLLRPGTSDHQWSCQPANVGRAMPVGQITERVSAHQEEELCFRLLVVNRLQGLHGVTQSSALNFDGRGFKGCLAGASQL